MSRLLCPKCNKAGLTWQTDLDDEDLLETGIMKCDNPDCGVLYKGIPGLNRKEYFHLITTTEPEGEVHLMRRVDCYLTKCIIKGCTYRI